MALFPENKCISKSDETNEIYSHASIDLITQISILNQKYVQGQLPVYENMKYFRKQFFFVHF